MKTPLKSKPDKAVLRIILGRDDTRLLDEYRRGDHGDISRTQAAKNLIVKTLHRVLNSLKG